MRLRSSILPASVVVMVASCAMPAAATDWEPVTFRGTRPTELQIRTPGGRIGTAGGQQADRVRIGRRAPRGAGPDSDFLAMASGTVPRQRRGARSGRRRFCRPGIRLVRSRSVVDALGMAWPPADQEPVRTNQAEASPELRLGVAGSEGRGHLQPRERRRLSDSGSGWVPQ